MTPDWTAILSAVCGAMLPSLAMAVTVGKVLARMDGQDRILARLESKLDSQGGEDKALSGQLIALGERLHAAKNLLQFLQTRLENLENDRSTS